VRDEAEYKGDSEAVSPGVRRCRDAGGVTAYLADVATLARKDLRLELRARSVVPAMLLFVVAALVVFHFALPAGSSDLAAKGLLWVAIVFTALLGLTRAFVAEREQRLLDGLLLAPCDRSAIWLAKTISMLGFLVVAELVALPAFALFFSGIDAATVAGVALADVGMCAVGTVLAAMAVAGRARELLLPLLFLPLAIPIVIGGVGASVVDEPARYLGFLVLYDAVFAIISWASFEYVVTE
jgi:heme exporter protein B